MADIPLRTYIQQLDNLIERKNVDEAIAHSRHILSFYPKHLDTYRMLGKALLEKGRHGDAADVFQRVLSVLPDDFISHVGMAIVREDEANLEAALWHMERAFEATPSNGAIQQELCRLYGRRDGVVPPKARLTRGALGRMYTQGGLYMQAEAELKAALANDPDRIDLQTILAQVYWYSEQPAASAQLCGVIVQSLPYSQVGNRILRAIFRARGRDADAALYRQRLEALDPYEALAPAAGDGATLSTADEVAADKVLVTRLEYVAGMESAGGPDWIASIGARFEEPLANAGDGTPDWLNTPAEAFERADMPGSAATPDWLAEDAAAQAEPAAAQSGDLPAWLSEMSQAGAASAPAPVADADLPDWLKGAAAGPLADEDVPAWMQTVAGGTATPAGDAASDETVPGWLAAAQTDTGQLEAPDRDSDWMDTVVHTPTSEPSAAPVMAEIQPNADSDLPDWLKAAAPASALDNDLPDWLQASTGALSGTPPVDAAGAGAPAPWLAGAEFEAPAEPSAEAPAGDEVPDWLSEASAPAPDEATPVWMTADTPAETAATPEAPTMVFHAEQPAADLAPANDLSDWLAGLTSGAPAEAVPDWMQAAPDAAAPAKAAPPAADEEPAWLPLSAAAVDEASAAPEDVTLLSATPAVELPEWLQAMQPEALADDVTLDSEPPATADALPTEVEAFIVATPAEDLPAWLHTATSAAPSDEVPAWLQAPSGETDDSASSAVSELEGEPEATAAIATPMEEMPAWLREAQADAGDDMPAWLQAPPSGEAPVETEPADLAAETPAEPTAPDAMPDWLQAATATTPAEEVAAWLQPGAVDYEAGSDAATPEAAPEPLALQAEEPASEAPAPAVSGELPEWLRDLTEDTEDNRTAHWEAMADAEFGAEEPGDLVEDETEEPELPLPEGIPVWLQAVAASAPSPDAQPEDAQPIAQPEAVEPVTAENPTADIELPDFLQLASPEAIARAAEPFAESGEFAAETTEAVAAEAAEADDALAPAEMPDWLKALAPESPIASTSVTAFDSDVMAAAAAGLNLDEAPDWMKAAQPGTPAEASLPGGTGGLDLGSVPDWLQAAQPEPPALGAMDLGLDEAPDWLQEAAGIRPAEAGDSALPAEADTPAWLQGAASVEQPIDLPPWAQTEVPGPTDTISSFLAGKDTPEWLQALRAHASEPEAVLPASEALPDEVTAIEPVELIGAEHDLTASPADEPELATVMEAAPPAEEAAIAVEPGLDDMSPDDAMRWLESLAARQGAPADELIMTAAASTPEVPAEASEVAEPAALAEPALEAPAAEAASATDDWLREVEASFEVDGLADTAPHARAQADAALPEWLSTEASGETELESSPEPALETPTPSRPEWLSEMEALAGDETGAEAAPSLANMSADEALRWLEEQASLAEAKAVPVQGLAENQGRDDLGLDDAAKAEAGVPDIEAMDADEAMAWLEKLAAQQGASADELLTAPEDRPDDVPAWLAASPPDETGDERPSLEPGQVPEWLAALEATDDDDADDAPLEPGILPDWLKPPSEVLAEAVGEAVMDFEAAGPPEDFTSSGPDFASMDAEAAMAWLESLAAQQGANPEELMTAPEERPAEAPAWVSAEQEAAALAVPVDEPVTAEPPAMEVTPPVEAVVPEPAVAEAAPAEPPELPETPETPAEPARETGSPPSPDVSKLSRLSERLAAGRRAKEAEIEARFAQQRAEQEEARRLVWESMQAKKAAMEAAAEPVAVPPAAEPEAPPPAAPPVRTRTGPLTPITPRRVTGPLPALPDESAWVPATPPHPRPVAVPSRYAGQAPETVLAAAEAHLAQEDAAEAAAALDHLVSAGEMVDSVIATLEGAAGPATAVPLLRVLGDAYARSNRLEQALETYRQALRRL